MYNGVEVTHPDAIRAMGESQRIAAPQIISTHSVVTLGSVTKNGGVVHTATSQMTIAGDAVALVGDEVLYPNGEITYITSGAGLRMVKNGKSVAIEGSRISNGDVIEKSKHHSKLVLDVREGMSPSPGFLQEGYVPPPHQEV